MALFHFKKGINENMSAQKMQENHFGCKPEKDQPNLHGCNNNQPLVLLPGINLGDIMKQTIADEMKLIAIENEMNRHRMGGS